MARIWTRIYRRLRYGRPIVVVSGLPRSGTSMTMKMLEAGGLEVFVDGIRKADLDNPKGYYEFERVKNLAEEPEKAWLDEARGKAVKIISYLLKELPRDRNYKVLFMHRSLEEVLASQSKMLDRRGESQGPDDARMIEIYKDHLWKVGYLIKHGPHLDVLDLQYRDVLDNPRRAAERIRDFLGADVDVDRMAGVVDPDLYRNRA